jgi:hypothetical protein
LPTMGEEGKPYLPYLLTSLPYTFFLLNDDIELNNNRQVFVNNML